MKKLIIKVQVPLAGHALERSKAEGHTIALIYDKKRSFMTETPIPEGVVKALNGDPKGYFNAKLHSDGQLEIKDRVGAQNW